MSGNAQPTKSKLFSFAEVKPVPPAYLWKPYLIENNINYIYGAGGSGKTMLDCALISALTHGEKPAGMPGEIPGSPVNVIYFGREDDAENYSYRLSLCGADVSRVFSIGAADMPGMIATGEIRQRIEEVNAKLIIFDPIQDFLPAGTDMNSTSDIRPLMEGLRKVCREAKCTALLVGHTNKNEKAKAANRASGSADLINASRSALFVGYHKDENGIRVAAHAKSNAQYGDSIKFSIDDTGRFCWLGTCDLTEEDIANAPRTKAPKAPATDPLILLIQHLVSSPPYVWQGTASQMLAQAANYPDCKLLDTPHAIGRHLPKIAGKLADIGICYTSSKRNGNSIHHFTIDKKVK